MLSTIPGYGHLKRLSPAAPRPLPEPQRLAPDDALRAPIRIAIDVASGVRPPTALQRTLFDAQVRIHIRAYLKTQPLRGPAALHHIDIHPAPTPQTTDPFAVRTVQAVDVVGTYSVAGKAKAFATRLELPEGKRQWIMRSLRLF